VSELCTLFDAAYLPRALVLHRSLRAHAPGARLRAYCVDRESKELLDRLALPGLVAVGFDELERDDPELAAVKPTRSRVEYCWTATPAICAHALAREPELERITYVDADLRFFADPAPVFAELRDASVAIVPHGYAPRWAHLEADNGTYNVEFVMFRRDAHGLEALAWWRERCLEWCHARVEDGKMGDQKYLDDWPERFQGVHVVRDPGVGLAPWNVEAHRLGGTPEAPTVDGRPLVFFHYHSLQLHGGGRAALRPLGLFRGARRTAGLLWTTAYPLPADEARLVWVPYLRELAAAYRELRALRPGFAAGILRPPFRTLLPDRVKPAFRALRRLARSRGWNSPSVARQMRALTDAQLARPESVPPLRVFLEAVTELGAVDLPTPARFLDVGCGVGHYADLLDERFEYTGADSAPAMVEAARAARPGRRFVVGDVLDPAFDLDSYDVVCASALLDVLPDPHAALERLLASAAPVVLLHRQRVTAGPSHVGRAPGYEGQTTYRTVLNRAELEQAVARYGRRILRVLPVEGEVESFVIVR
jgi:SAM-dependent methyltransferase